MTITELDELAELDAVARRPLEYRRATTVDVRHPERIIDIIAIPYDEETRVLDRAGRWVLESVAPGAFAGVERRANRVKVNLAHEVERVVGRAHALYPGDKRGLRAELRISRTPAGDDYLELAADGAIDASVGFAPMPGGETYFENRSRRRITRAYLGHIALTADPAYDGARVLAVRSSASGSSPPAGARAPTPNLDRVLLERRAAAAGLALPVVEA